MSRPVILLTRAGEGELETHLSSLDAEIVSHPVLSVEPAGDLWAIDAALRQVSGYQAIAFTSKSAAAPLLERARALRMPLEGPELWAVGRRTAAFVEQATGRSVRAPSRASGADLFAAIRRPIDGERWLLVRAPEGRAELGSALAGAGATVEELHTYHIADAPLWSAEAIEDLSRVTIAVFASGRTLEAFLRVVPAEVARECLERAQVAVIGPVAAEAAARLGVRVDIMPSEASFEALAEAIATALK